MRMTNINVRRTLGLLAVLVVTVGAGGCVPWWDEAPPADFYALPATGAKAPGTLERVQRVPSTRFTGVDVYRVAYWTRDRIDRPQVATGLVSIPEAAAPAGGRPIIAYAHGTAGMASRCAPSRNANGLPRDYVQSGVPVAAPDYIGLGPVGKRHSFLSGVSEARATIDIVRAASHLPGARFNGDWYAYGLSQGGHAVLFAGEEAPGYSPAHMHLRGIVAGAPPTKQLGTTDALGTPLQVVLVMALVGAAEDHPGLDPRAYLSPEAEARLGVIDTGCLNEIAISYTEIVPRSVLDVPVDARLAALMEEATPGDRPVGVPIHIFQGASDPIVSAAATRQFVAEACARGEVVDYAEYPGDHSSVLAPATPAVLRWLATVESGAPAPSTC